MANAHFLRLAGLLSVALVADAAAARTVTGPRGGTGSSSYSVSGTHFAAQASGTTAAGQSASAAISGVYHPASGTVTGAASVTGPQGATHGGTYAAGNGSATATGYNGQTYSYSRPQ